MSKKYHKNTHKEGLRWSVAISGAVSDAKTSISRDDYKVQLHLLQIELVKLQRHFIGCGDRTLVILEGRDAAAGKDGCVKRIVEYLSPRETRVVALGKPTEQEQCAWYFQHYVAELTVAGGFVMFNRSWYNRAGVEQVMGFCSKDEQKRRLVKRQYDPIKQWKISPIDAVAVKHWKVYSNARDEMLLRTHTAIAPWHSVRANNKRLARLNLMRDILSRLHYAGKKNKIIQPDPGITFEFTPECIDTKRLTR